MEDADNKQFVKLRQLATPFELAWNNQTSVQVLYYVGLGVALLGVILGIGAGSYSFFHQKPKRQRYCAG